MAYSRSRPDFSITLRTDIIEDGDIQILDITQPGHLTTTIINIYNDTPAKENCILQKIKNINIPNDHPTIITGDFNLHHDLWSRVNTTMSNVEMTESIVDWLSEKGFLLLNEKGQTTHPARHSDERDSVIDLSFINGPASVNDTFKDWCIDPTLSHDSDHFGIKFTIDHGRKIIDNPCGLKYNIKNTNRDEWTKAFAEELDKVQNILEPLSTAESLNPSLLDTFADTFTMALQQVTSRTSKLIKPSPQAKPWWDEEIKNASAWVAELRNEQKLTL
ncbi:hypothetical protein CVT25_000729, partial [Psilocybe cyanescens]